MSSEYRQLGNRTTVYQRAGPHHRRPGLHTKEPSGVQAMKLSWVAKTGRPPRTLRSNAMYRRSDGWR